VRYLRVRNWEQFQYRSDKRLPWIRTYDAQLEDYDYTQLSDAERGFLHDVRLLANRTGNRIPADPAWIARGTRSRSKSNAQRMVPKLLRLGFLEKIPAGTKTPAQKDGEDAPRAHTERTDRVLDREEIEIEKKRASPTAPTGAQALVAFFVDETKRRTDSRPPRDVTGHMAQSIGTQLKAGIEGERVRAGIVRMLDRGIVQPKLLSQFIAEAELPTLPRRNGDGGLTAQQIFEQGREEMERETR
jgi:hypothetical protein